MRKKKKIDLEQQVVDKIRDQLDKLGIFGDLLREPLWQEFDRRCGKDSKRPDVYLLLNCILNQTFTTLNLHSQHLTSFFSKNLDTTKLFGIIENRYPSLKKFSLLPYGDWSVYSEVSFHHLRVSLN